MLQSPLRRVTGVSEESIPWSPAFRLDETLYNFDDLPGGAADFDIFHDMATLDDGLFPNMSPLDMGSPIKRSARRPRPDRSLSTPALGDAPDSSSKRKAAAAPLLRLPDHSPSHLFETPSKALEGLGSPSKLFLHDSPIRHGASPGSKCPPHEPPADADWPGLVFDAADFMAHTAGGPSDFSGLDILQGFEKIGAGAPASKQPKPPPAKPALGRSFSTRF